MGFLDRTGLKTLFTLINEKFSKITTEFDEKLSSQIKTTSTKIDLKVSNWGTDLSQTVTIEGISADEGAQVIFSSPTFESKEEYENAGIKATNQGENFLTFTAESLPSKNLSVYIVVENVLDVTPP